MRKVHVIHRAPIYSDRQSHDSYQLGTFIQYGTDVVRYFDDFLPITVAVVEFDNGKVGLIPVKDITFL